METKTLKWFISVALILPVCLAAQQRTAKSAVSASSVMSHIAEQGAAREVSRLKAAGQWRAVQRSIQSGSTDWLLAAKKLHAGTDAGVSEELLFSFAIALTRNPKEVLAMAEPEFPLAAVCTVPYIEAEEQVLERHRRRVHAALAGVTTAARFTK